MSTLLNIKNFRVFDENGVTFELKPITILTGSNSSGKSSLVKAVFLLNGFLEQIKKAIENNEPIKLDKFKLDFTAYPNNLLGCFDKIIHKGSKSKELTIEYTVHSLMLNEDVTVKLSFVANNDDKLGSANLKVLSLETKNGVFFNYDKGRITGNLNVIKRQCFDYLEMESKIMNLNMWDAMVTLGPSCNIKVPHHATDKETDLQHINDNLDLYWSVFYYALTNDTLINTLLNPDQSLYTKIKQENTLFMVPLLEETKTITKNDFPSFIKPRIASLDTIVDYDIATKEGLIAASNKIVNDFMQSEFDTFYDYFVAAENDFLKAFHLVDSLKKFQAKGLQGFGGFHYSIFGQTVYDEDYYNNCVKISFGFIYDILMLWNHQTDSEQNGLYSYGNVPPGLGFQTGTGSDHISYRLLNTFANCLFREVLCPEWVGSMSYVSSSRATVKKFYPLENTDDFTKLLRNYIEARISSDIVSPEGRKRNTIANKFNRTDKKVYKIDSFIDKWLEKFEIGKQILFDVDEDGLAVKIRIKKSDNDETERLLADEGYGITQIVSIMLQIETAIITAKQDIRNMGVFTTMADYFDYKTTDEYNSRFRYHMQYLAIEEPEIHLHPKYQSLLADMFLEAYEKYNIHFIIETHSEYLIRKAQVFVARSKYENEDAMKKNNPFKVYYVPTGDKPYEMRFSPDGRFLDEFGKGFFDEAANLAFEIL